MNKLYDYYPELETAEAFFAADAFEDFDTEAELEFFDLGSGATDLYPARELDEEFSFADFPRAVLKALRTGLERVAVSLAVGFGARDENKLADLVFFARHPERGGRLLRRGEKGFKQLSQEWLGIRDRLVRLIAARAFFTEYELRFNPGSTTFGIPANTKMSASEKASRTADVRSLVIEGDRLLVSRRDRRAAAALKRRVLPSKKVPAALEPVARRLSTAQLALFREFFPDRAGGINFKAFQFSFELFANGELRNPTKGSGFGEPDGGFYFLFSEFAILCIDSEIEKAVWIKALRTFVKTQEIFLHVYRPGPHRTPPSVWSRLPRTGSVRRGLDAYHHRNFDAAGQSDERRKKRLRSKYGRMSLRRLRRAARDNMLLAQRMP